ncbi:MAG: hypothetical protein M0T69_02160 [Deltaproteobacteria bacterium]|nr:hypothetical protein [Deltaproteobacteria bacterium]
MSELAPARTKELDRADKAIALIIREFAQATSMNGAFHSAHEGLAVILEELDELKEEVWKKARNRDPDAMIKEAKQVGAMAMRFLVDVALPLKERRNAQ